MYFMTTQQYLDKILKNVRITEDPDLTDKSNDPYFVEKKRRAEELLSKATLPDDLKQRLKKG